MKGFVWDERKNRSNQVKHGIAFEAACEAFIDENRVIVRDVKHSLEEARFHCIGRTADGILTCAKAGKLMRKKIHCEEGPEGEWEVVEDFLPSPSMLAAAEKNVEVSIVLTQATVDLFKEQAQRFHEEYPELIRRVVEAYAFKCGQLADTHR